VGPQHGYAISQIIRAHSSEALRVETGSLYPALHRLQKQKLVKSAWGTTDAKQREVLHVDAGGQATVAARARSVGAVRGRHRRRPES
jgi:DNA-binding PadR family transcriptional regulator